jgi:hypothetical protein
MIREAAVNMNRGAKSDEQLHSELHKRLREPLMTGIISKNR